MIKTTIVGFGDSLIYGYGVDMNVGFMARLEKYMPQYYPEIAWNIINSGVNGDTSREGKLRLKKSVLIHNPNIVLILFGSNDSALYEYQYRTEDEFEKNITDIVDGIKSHNNHSGLNGCVPIPMLITPPPVTDAEFMPYTTNERVAKYAEIVRTVAKSTHSPLIDFHSYMIEESDGSYGHMLQSDGVHLSPAGYDCLYDIVFSSISRLITYDGILKDFE